MCLSSSKTHCSTPVINNVIRSDFLKIQYIFLHFPSITVTFKTGYGNLFSTAVPSTSLTDFRKFRTMLSASFWKFLKLTIMSRFFLLFFFFLSFLLLPSIYCIIHLPSRPFLYHVSQSHVPFHLPASHIQLTQDKLNCLFFCCFLLLLYAWKRGLPQTVHVLSCFV